MKLKPSYFPAVAAVLVSAVAVGQGNLPVNPQEEEKDTARFASPKERLGEMLFHDTRLSEPACQSCASRHDANFASTDPDQWTPTSQGVNPKLFGSRNTPTAMYMAFSPAFHFDEEEGLGEGGQFLDGRAATLEDQA